MTYYNEYNYFLAKWLRNLFPDSYVDSRDIRDVGNRDTVNYDKVHLFAGIGGWEYALQLAGWPKDRPIWTGSPPCQPFSQCGKRKGEKDERHLWPEMLRLIEARRPPIVFGEQVAGKRGLEWFDGVRTDLEEVGYSCGMAVLPAASVNAPHKRERIFWVADASWPARNRPIMRSNARTYSRVVSKKWRDYYSYSCSDGKVRRVGVGVQPLDARVPTDLEQLRAYGNSIVPQVGAVFIRSYMEIKGIV